MTTYEFSVVELHGQGWYQGKTLDLGSGSAEEIGKLVSANLNGWIEECDTGSDEEPFSPALEINITREEL